MEDSSRVGEVDEKSLKQEDSAKCVMSITNFQGVSEAEIQAMKEPVVLVRRTDPAMVQILQDETLINEGKSIIENITKNNISYLIRIQNPNINDVFPLPDCDLPLHMQYPGKGLRRVTVKLPKKKQDFLKKESEEFVGSTPVVRRGRTQRYFGTYNEDLMNKATPSGKEAEAKTFKRARNASESSASSTKSIRKKTVVKKQVLSSSSSSSNYSSSSNSDSDSEETTIPSSAKTANREAENEPGTSGFIAPTCRPTPMANPKPVEAIRVKRLVLSSSSDEEIPAAAPSKAILLKLPIKANEQSPSVSSTETATKQSKFQLPVAATKTITLRVPNLKKPAEANKLNGKVFTVPKIVEPPRMNPKTNKPLTAKEEDNLLKKRKSQASKSNPLPPLGGIFSIDNGWEKTAEKLAADELAASVKDFKIPKRTSATVTSNSLLTEPAPVEATVQSSTTKRSPIRIPHSVPGEVKEFQNNSSTPQSTERKAEEHTKFSRYDTESESEDEMDLLATNTQKSDSEDDTEEPPNIPEDENKEHVDATTLDDSVDSQDELGAQTDRAQQTHIPNIAALAITEQADKIDESDSENEDVKNPSKRRKTSTGQNEDDDDRLSLGDALELDFDEEFEEEDEPKPPAKRPKVVPERKAQPQPKRVQEPEDVDNKMYTSELDELKMVVKVDIPPPPKTEEEINRELFNQTTALIIANGLPKKVDTAQRVIPQFFGPVCISFLENKCIQSDCKLHFFPEIEVVRQKFDQAILKQVEEVFSIATRYRKILDQFFGLFAEIFIKKQLSTRENLIRMIRECEHDARSYHNYRIIVEALVQHATNMARYEAVRFVINNHKDSTYAREILMTLIVETGPEIVRFMDYLQWVNKHQTIPAQILDKVLRICVMYQNPLLPTFCLNNLLLNYSKPNYKNQINPDHFTKFVTMQGLLTSDNNDREQKLEDLVHYLAAGNRPQRS